MDHRSHIEKLRILRLWKALDLLGQWLSGWLCTVTAGELNEQTREPAGCFALPPGSNQTRGGGGGAVGEAWVRDL